MCSCLCISCLSIYICSSLLSAGGNIMKNIKNSILVFLNRKGKHHYVCYSFNDISKVITGSSIYSSDQDNLDLKNVTFIYDQVIQ
jgi:hypothetical protein